MRFDDHPLRQWTVDELHLRKFAPVSGHCEIYQAVRLIETAERGDEDLHLTNRRPDFDSWQLAPRHASGHSRSGIFFLWERHTEASTLTLIVPHDCPDQAFLPFVRWLEQWVGTVIRATRIFVVPDNSDIQAQLRAQQIKADDVVCSDINGALRIWSDFGIHGDGYGRLVMTAGEVSDSERGRIVQRVQELGNYRNLALLGFPTVLKYGPQVDQIERDLSDHMVRVAQAGDDDGDELLLQQLADISSKLELIRSATSFRLSATTAYAEVAADRLQALAIVPVANFQSLAEFTERRLVPAARTCSVFRDRLDRIAERIARVMHMLDVRIDTRIKAQNLSLTTSMERSTQLQFRLQTLVEGLSIIAAAYYLIGLIAYVVKGIKAFPSGSSSDIVIGALTLPVVLLIYAFIRRLRGKVLQLDDSES